MSFVYTHQRAVGAKRKPTDGTKYWWCIVGIVVKVGRFLEVHDGKRSIQGKYTGTGKRSLA